MAHGDAQPAPTRLGPLDPARRRQARLFKVDRPRRIDRYIDYFGGAGHDTCGERLLDALERWETPR